MNAADFRKWLEAASGVGSLAADLAASGIRSVMEVVRGIPIFGSLSAMNHEVPDRDETHYLLVPKLDGNGFSIFRKRVLPAGVGAENRLPKARIFHVPDASSKGVMERELSKVLAQEAPVMRGAGDEVADLLDRVADEIDRETPRVSGGLLIIGGVVALVNPLVGIGIAAKSLLPSLGSSVARAGSDFVVGKLRDWGRKRDEARRLTEAAREVKRLKPEVFENPVLRALDLVISQPDHAPDPFLDVRTWPDAFPHLRHYAVTREAFSEVFTRADLEQTRLGDTQRAWVREMMTPLPAVQS